ELALDYAAGGAVKRDPVSRFEDLTLSVHFALLFVHVNVARSGNAAFTHAAGNHGCVAGHATARGKNSGGDVHAVKVFGSSSSADHDHRVLFGAGPGLIKRFGNGETDLSEWRARG